MQRVDWGSHNCQPHLRLSKLSCGTNTRPQLLGTIAKALALLRSIVKAGGVDRAACWQRGHGRKLRKRGVWRAGGKALRQWGLGAGASYDD